ncbi:MAG TPA: IclR family transcriptional regulator [Symbiobacteriaceae bacterium]|nr:IclR family transcriptional regulator [Symbiobacteriaceae bacterium]
MVQRSSGNAARSGDSERRESGVKSLAKALDVLNYMGRRRHPVGVTELANELGLNKSAVHRLLQTLEATGFVDRNPLSRQYFLGPRLFVLGKVFETTVTLRGLARPIMERLAGQLGEAVHLMVPARSEKGLPSLILLDKIDSAYQLSITPSPGAVSPAHCTAGGKVLLAFASSDALRQVKDPLPRHTEHTITTVAALRTELADIRSKGYATDREELELGLTCLAAPVFEGKEVIAAISVSGPTFRVAGDSMNVVREAVVAAAAEIGRLLV